MANLTQHQLSVLKSNAMFSSLDAQMLDNFVTNCDKIAFKTGEVIFREHKPAESFYIILAGHVKIYKLSPAGTQQVLHIFGPGQSFAEAVILKNKTYPAYAEAIQPTTLLRVTRDYFYQALFEDRNLVTGMLSGLFAKLRELASLAEELSLKTVPARLAGFLLSESQKAGADHFELTVSKQQIADIIGTKPETLSRALKKMSSQGIISVSQKNVKISDLDALNDLAAGF